MPVIVRATGFGTPMCCSTPARSEGPSLSRKKRLRTANERPSASDVISVMPVARPPTSVEMTCGASALTLPEALDAPDESTPASSSQPWMSSTASLAIEPASSAWETIPPITRKSTRAPSATRPRRTMPAPAARGTRCRPSQLTSGEATDATTKATSTGCVMTAVAPRSQTSPKSSAATPTRSHDAIPRSRSQRGAEKTAESSSTPTWMT